MPALTAVVTHATGDVFPASDWNSYVRDDINYLIQAGAPLASAATITTTNEFHQVTGTTTINTISATTPLHSQELQLWFQSPLTISNSAGNIRFPTGLDRQVHANEIVTLVYDSLGSVWREMRPLPGQRLAFGNKQSGVSNSGGTFAVGTDVLASALSFTADGTTSYIFEFYAAAVTHTQVSTFDISLNLDGADGGIISFGSVPSAGGGLPVGTVRRLLAGLAAGVHTVNARIFSGAGTTLTLQGGAGGAGGWSPIHAAVEVLA